MTTKNKPVYSRVYYTITFLCNMHCRKCVNMSPYHAKPRNPSIEEVKLTLDKIFEIADYLTFDFCGGELFVRKDFAEIMRYAHRYDSSVKDFWCIVTNCSFPMTDEMLEVIKLYGSKLKIKLDNYGPLSKHFQTNYDKLTEIDAWVEVHHYTGENQYYGGWMDRQLSPEPLWNLQDAEELWSKCQGSRNSKLDVVADLVTYCTTEYNLRSIYGIPEFDNTCAFSLLDSTLTIEQMREKCEKILDCSISHEACRYHNIPFSNTVTARIPAAEQLTAEEINAIHSGKLSNEEIYAILKK